MKEIHNKFFLPVLGRNLSQLVGYLICLLIIVLRIFFLDADQTFNVLIGVIVAGCIFLITHSKGEGY